MYKRKIERLRKQKDLLEVRYNGNETSPYNFYGGWDLGYIVGQLSVLEDIQDEYEENVQTVVDEEKEKDLIMYSIIKVCRSRV